MDIFVGVNGPYLSLRFEYDAKVIEQVRLIPGRKFHRGSCSWLVPLTAEAVTELSACLPSHSIHFDSAVDMRLAELRKAEQLTNEIKAGSAGLPSDMQFPQAYPPMSQQRTALALAVARSAFGLFMEMGSGKTYVILALLNWLRCKPSLIVCPASVMSVWQDQAAQFYPDLKVELLTGPISERIARLRLLQSDIYVINYEATWRMAEALTEVKWKSLTLDEGHRIKGRTTKQAKALVKLGRGVPRRYLLTGTPMPNSPLELFSQFNFLDPAILGPNFYAFRDRYAIMGGYQGYQAIGWKNMDELSAKIAAHSYRVLKRDCMDLPEKVYTPVRLTLQGDQKTAYSSMAKTLVAELGKDKEVTASVIISKLIKLREIASGFCITDDGQLHYFKENAKLQALRDIVEDLPETGKLVIWCMFKAELSRVKQLLDSMGHESVTISGDVAVEDRGELVKRFQTEPKLRFFIGQQRAGGLGITLTAASNCVFFSNDYSPEIRLQAEDRLHRIGQTNKVTYWDLLCKGTIDTSIRAALKRKQNLSAMVTGDMVEKIILGE